MGLAIAITGKGGSGKTTIAAITVGLLVRRGRVPVLAVDADPNACLDETLGVRAEATIGSAREELRDGAAKGDPASKRDILQMKAARAMVESDGFDLIAMGRPEGPGCYCYANNLLRDIIQEIAAGYPYIVIDNEAGLENLSRRIVRSVDCLVIAADSSRRGLETVRRIRDLAHEMGIRHRRLAVVVNRVRGEPDLSALPEADFLVRLPEDGEILRAGEEGTPLQEIPAGNPVTAALGAFIDELLRGETV